MTSSPLQLAVATAALANKGQLFQPTLLKNTKLTDQSMTEFKKPIGKQIPINNIQNWETVIDGMRQVIYSPKGTARRLNKKLTYTLAGKTGTAQVFGWTLKRFISQKNWQKNSEITPYLQASHQLKIQKLLLQLWLRMPAVVAQKQHP